MLGMLMGAAMGDAMGAAYEFEYNRIQYQDDLRPHDGLLGTITDDTEMMMALAYEVIALSYETLPSAPAPSPSTPSSPLARWNQREVVEAYCRWVMSGPLDVGNNTSALFGSTSIPGNFYNSYLAAFKKATMDTPIERWSQSNGCLMRCMPMIVFPEKDKVWRKDCALSNPHPVCLEACDVYFRLLHNLFSGRQETLEDISRTVKHPVVFRAVRDALERQKRDVRYQRGWVCHALYFACMLYAYHYDTFEDAMRMVIGEHLDSDTDTNACIAGAVWGAKHGPHGFLSSSSTKDKWHTMMALKSYRPDALHVKHLGNLAFELGRLYDQSKKDSYFQSDINAANQV